MTMTWAAFLADEASERLMWQRWTATAMSASLHAAAVVAVVAALPWPPDGGSDWGADVTFERALKVDVASVSAPVASTALPEAAPTDPPSSADFLPPMPAVEIATPHLPPVVEAPPVTAAELASPKQVPVLEAPPQPQQASAAPESLPLEAKLEEMLPHVEAPPNVSARDFPAKPAAAPPARPQRAEPAPVQPPVARQPVQEARREGPPAGQPARAAPQDAYAQRRSEEDYFLQIVRKISRYRFHSTARQSPEQGLVVTRMTIARDGRLLDVALVRSSGFPNLDWAVVETIRQASPFAPLPAELGQNQRTFIVPVNYSRDR